LPPATDSAGTRSAASRTDERGLPNGDSRRVSSGFGAALARGLRGVGSGVALRPLLVVVVAAAILPCSVTGCGSDESADVGSLRGDVAVQLALLRQGDVKALVETFTEKVRPAITEEYVRSRQPIYAQVTAESLVGPVAVKEVEGVKTADVWTPDGAPLGRFVFVNGRWLADTLWFR